MMAAIHQPHYFPWLGYFDKIAKADCFVLLDRVQLEKGSQMVRNRVLSDRGEVKYITITAETSRFLEREYRSIQVKDTEEWKTRQKNVLAAYYRKAAHRDEGLQLMDDFLKQDFPTVCEWTCSSIRLGCRLLGIHTDMVYQSEVDYPENDGKSDLVLAICKALGSDCYLSGRGGSVRYLNREKFRENGVTIAFQSFQHPSYPQCGSAEFVPGLSILDSIMNCGAEGTKELFWKNFRKTEGTDSQDK